MKLDSKLFGIGISILLALLTFFWRFHETSHGDDSMRIQRNYELSVSAHKETSKLSEMLIQQGFKVAKLEAKVGL
jgi:hypothetical protein